MATDQQLKELDDLGITQAVEDPATTDDTTERNQLNDTTGSEIPFRNDSKKKRGFHFTKKQGITGGIIGLVVGGGFGIFGILSGPAQIVHFSQLLQQFHFSNNNDFADDRTNRYLYHRLRGTNTGGPGYAKMRTRLGVIGNRVGDVLELKMQQQSGLRSLYDTRTGNLIGYEMISRDRAISAIMGAGTNPDLDWQTISPDQLPSNVSVVGFDGRGLDGRSYVLLAAPSESQSLVQKMQEIGRRRGFQKNLTKQLGMSKVASAVGFRKTAQRGKLDLSPWRKLDQAINQSATDYSRQLKEKIRERWRDEARNGKETPRNLSLRNTDSNGEPLPENEEIGRAQAEQAGIEAQADANSGDKVGAKGRTSAKIAGIATGGTVIGIGVLCAARSISDNAENVKHANIVMPLMRVGTRVVSMGSQVMTGQNISMEEVGVLSEMLHDEELGSWAGARSIQAEQGLEPTGPEISPTAKPSRVGEKPAFFEVLDNIFGALGPGGDAACSDVGQFLLGVATGGPIDEIVGEVVGRTASAAGVNPMDKLASWIVDVLAGEEVDVDAVGADLGNNANYGARLAANEHALSMGGALLSNEQVSELDNQKQSERINEFQTKSFFARTFNVYEPGSAASKVLFENNSLAMLMNKPGNVIGSAASIFSNFNKLFARTFSPTLSAYTPYEYGFGEYGFSLEEQENEKFSDPYENALFVEPQLANLTTEYGSCFSSTINPQTGAIEGSEPKAYGDIESKCHDRNNESLQRYRFYIADTILSKSLACYEGVDENMCSEVGLGGTAPTTQVSSQPANVSPTQDTSGMQCPQGTTDGGVHQDYGPGRVPTVNVRICDVKGVRGVNASIAQSALEMINAAESAGHILAGGAFRSYDTQEQLRVTNGCPPGGQPDSCRVPTAIPGNSNHEVGLAIDFDNMCYPRRTCPSSAAWNWLTANAATYGFKPLAKEAWHWSKDGR